MAPTFLQLLLPEAPAEAPAEAPVDPMAGIDPTDELAVMLAQRRKREMDDEATRARRPGGDGKGMDVGIRVNPMLAKVFGASVAANGGGATDGASTGGAAAATEPDEGGATDAPPAAAEILGGETQEGDKIESRIEDEVAAAPPPPPLRVLPQEGPAAGQARLRLRPAGRAGDGGGGRSGGGCDCRPPRER